MKKLSEKFKNFNKISKEEQVSIGGGLCGSLLCEFRTPYFTGIIYTVNGAQGCTNDVKTICSGYFGKPVNTVLRAGNNCGGATYC